MMNDLEHLNPPADFEQLQAATALIGFTMACETQTGSLLRTLAASKPASRFMEIGTGTGISACWILDGMDSRSTLISIEQDERANGVAKAHLGHDPRVNFITGNAEDFLKNPNHLPFDFIFADTFPGKFYLRDEALKLLNPGGLYIVDDLLPQPTWPENHQLNVTSLIAALENHPDLHITKLHWASGIIIATKRSH